MIQFQRWVAAAVAWVGLGVVTASAGHVVPVPPPADPTWADVVRSSAGARAVQLETEMWAKSPAGLPYLSSRAMITTRWPDAVRIDEHRLPRADQLEERVRTVGERGRLTCWTWRDAARQTEVGHGAFVDLMTQQMALIARLGVELGPEAARRLGPIGDLQIDPTTVLQVSEGLEHPGLRVYELPPAPAGGLDATYEKIRSDTRWLFAQDRNRVVGMMWGMQPLGSVALEMRVTFDPDLPGDFFAFDDPPGVAWLDNPTWGEVVAEIRTASALQMVVTQHEAVGGAGRVATFREQLAVRRGAQGVDAWRSDWQRAEGAHGLSAWGLRVVTRTKAASWWPDRGRVTRSTGDAAWHEQLEERRVLMGRLGVDLPPVAGGSGVHRPVVPDEVRLQRTATQFLGRPAWRGFCVPPEVARDRPDLSNVTYWLGDAGRLMRVAVNESGSAWTVAVQTRPRLPEDFFALDDPPGFVEIAAPEWGDVLAFSRGASSLGFDKTRYTRGADGQWSVVQKAGRVVRWPDLIRLDFHPVDAPRDAAHRKMVIGRRDRGLVQADDGKPGVIYPGSSVFKQLFPETKTAVHALGRTLKDGAASLGTLSLDPAMRLLPSGLIDPEGRGWRAYRLPAGTSNKTVSHLAREVVYWFAPDELKLKGFSFVRPGQGKTKLGVWVVKVDPVLPASFTLIDRRVCGDWSY